MRPERRPDDRVPMQPPPPELLFCAVCQVSIAAVEVERGEARRTPRGRLFCALCTRATPEERARRRTALEVEFADDAPVPVPVVAAARGRVAPGAPADAAAASAGAPPHAASVLEARVGELERAVFRLRARVTHLEERLQEAAARLP